jgi:lysine-ketoglutarate reductase/saccharopine dehydrogenase-like protein (TIGR00300 family)
MFSEQIELRGHIIDSLTLPKVLDEILAAGAEFKVRQVKIGEQRVDPSYARVEIFGKSPELLDKIVRRLRLHGAVVIKEENVQVAPAPADGVFPENFHVTTNQETFVSFKDKWLEVRPTIMDSGITVDLEKHSASAVKFYEIRKGMPIVIGHRGVRVMPLQRTTEERNVFEFMASNVSSEKPKSAVIREIARQIRLAHEAGGKIAVVAGPALVHTGGDEHLEKLIQRRYVNLLFSGNALAVHDIEQSLFGTSLGVNVAEGALVDEGHNNHMRAINTIRLAGGIARAVETGVLRSGIMYQCVRQGVPFVLAGSIRDDGPLPEVITDRGSFQAVGLVTDLEPFLRELTDFLAEGGVGA